MKNSIALLLSFFLVSFTLASCEDMELEPCYDCGGNGNNGGNSSVVFDELSDPPMGSDFHTLHPRLVHSGMWADFNRHIIADPSNYIALKLVPVYDLNGFLKIQNGEQLYSIESFQYAHH